VTERPTSYRTERIIVTVLLVLAASPLVVRTFFFQTFAIPSGSMVPTVLSGDYIFVSKSAYGYTHYSLPFSPPLFSGRILAAEPQRGDVVVFRHPKDDSTDYMKRIVGLPGDRIQMIRSVLHINGVPTRRERISDYVDSEGGRAVKVRRWRETLPNGVSYDTLDVVENGYYDDTPVYAVPAGHYFMMGDNRDNSTDSRVLRSMGYVPFENLIGRVSVIFWSIDKSSDKADPDFRFERIGTPVR
jgi:signal peptidase I